MSSSDQGEDSFLVELLNAKERHGYGTRQSPSFMAPPPNGGTAMKDEVPGWDDGGEYARAAEAAGVDVGGMLEAGVDAKQLLEFVSNFRRHEGDKLGLLDEQNLKFATSQVLREGPRAGADAVRAQLVTATDGRSRGAPAAGASAWGFAAEGEGREREAREAPSRVAARQPLQPRNGISPTPDPHLPVGGREAAGAGPSTRNRDSRSTRHAAGHPSVRPSASGRPFGEDDRVETARLCGELLRWSSALEGAERQLERKGGSAGPRGDGPGGGNGARTNVLADDAIEEGSERSSTSTRENFHHEELRGDERGTTHRDTRNDPGRSHAAHGEEETRAREHGRRRSRRNTGDAKVDADVDVNVDGGRDRSRSIEDIYDVEDVDIGDWERGGLGPAWSPSRRRVGGARRGTPSNNNGHERPTPSYALPTKHFKTIDRDRRHLLYAEDADGQKQLQRQAHLEDENAALKLRLEGQRRAIHELEHQANTLREDARLREEELSRLKTRVVKSSSGSGGKWSCCASTHHARARATGVSGPSALKKRALAAEGRTQTLERCLRESRAKEQRSREIVASLKHSYSDAQAKITGLEAELESERKSLSEARRELVESRRDAKGRMKDTRKHRRQQGEKEREAEIARAEAADLAAQLRKASRDVERARLEAAQLREEKARAESEAKDLTRENRMLQDRLNDGSLRSRIRERDRWILAELRSESRSPPRRSGPPKESHAATGRPPAPSTNFRARAGQGGPRRQRHVGIEDASLDSTSGSEPCAGSHSCSHPPKTAVRCQDKEEGASGRLPPKGGRRVNGAGGWAGGVPDNGAGRRLSTRSADGAAEGALGDAAVLRGSTLSGGSARSSTMGARYERLQAMYRRVNRRDGGTRGRAGVG